MAGEVNYPAEMRLVSEPKRTEVLDLLFNTTTGAGFTIVRNGIGSSPSSNSDWMNTFLPVSPGKPGDLPKSYVKNITPINPKSL